MEAIGTRGNGIVLSDAIAVIGVLVALLFGVYVSLNTTELVMQLDGALFTVFGAVGLLMVLTRLGSSQTEQTYHDNVIKGFVIAAMFWGVAGFLVGDIIAWQLAFPALNFDLPWTNFGRLASAAYISRDLRLRR